MELVERAKNVKNASAYEMRIYDASSKRYASRHSNSLRLPPPLQTLSQDGPNQSTPTDRLTTNILEVKGGGSTTSGKGGKRQARGQGSGKRGRTRAAKDTDNKIVVKSTALSGATDSQPPPPPPSTLEEIIQQMQQLQQLVSGLANRAER
ncbi:hypothetical protein BDZ91DRAFT_806803 [Kalaharituber pfeilii]|nr:hypothetical protein BDZ91DRAFT_806803 [Kalaharituber pfeilii]